jgi:hypothetical protein
MRTRQDSIQQAIATYEALREQKQQRLDHWQLLCEYLLPHKAAVTQTLEAYSRPYAEKYDATGMLAASDFAANLYNNLTPSDRRWFLLTPPALEPDLVNDRSYGESLAQLTERLHLAMQQTNSETELHSVYEDLTIGTACLAVKKDAQRGFSFSSRPIREYCFLTDDEGRPESVFIERSWTAYEAARRFGYETLPESLRKLLEEQKADAYRTRRGYLNVMRPNEAWNPSLFAGARQKYENLWIDMGEKRLLEEGGSRRLRYVITRFRAAADIPWGMGPGDMAYSWVRCLDKSVEIFLKYAAKRMDPPLLASDDGAYGPLATTPGSVIIQRLGATDRQRPEFLEIQGDHGITELLLQYFGSLIMRSFMNELFQVVQDDKQRTAEEFRGIIQKSYSMAIPILGRQKAELFRPLIALCLELMTEHALGIEGWTYQGKALPDYRYTLELVSPLALAIKYSELKSMDDARMVMTPWAEIDPSIWDHWSLNDVAWLIQDSMGIPTRLRRSASAVRQIRAARAQQMAQQQALEQTRLASEATNKLSKRVEEGSPLAAMTGMSAMATGRRWE